MPVPSRIRINSPTSPKKPPLNPSYSQVIKTSPNPQACDPGKYQVIRSPDPSCDLSASQASHDQATCDRGKLSGDLPRDWSPTRSSDCVNFRSMMRLLINTWKTVGTINKGDVVNQGMRLTAAQSVAVILSCFDHPHTNNLLALKGSSSVTHSKACPKAAHRPPYISI
jgi:hypothetical protein